jgi:hypothetical protein
VRVSLPRSAVLALWLNAFLRGSVGPDDLGVGVREDDPHHLVVDWPEESVPLDLTGFAAIVGQLGDARVNLALPAPGDLLGLGGPPAFNAEVVDAGEAVVITGRTVSLGVVPELDARTVLWRTHPAAPVQLLDPGEASRTLRQVLLEATAELVRLDVAQWQPEIPDLLLNLQHRPALNLPPGTPPAALESLERAVLCSDIVDLARADHGGAVTAFEISERARCLTDLDRAARRAIVAFCSASLSAS